MTEFRIDPRIRDAARSAEAVRSTQLCFRINHTMPRTPECDALIRELFPDMGEGSWILPPLQVNLANRVKIGKRVSIMFNLLCLSAGGITIGDDVILSANVSLLSNGHDFYDRQIVTCKPIHIERNVWIGAGATILPGVTVGENSIVGACSVVTRSVPANVVVAGSPAKIIRDIGTGD